MMEKDQKMIITAIFGSLEGMGWDEQATCSQCKFAWPGFKNPKLSSDTATGACMHARSPS